VEILPGEHSFTLLVYRLLLPDHIVKSYPNLVEFKVEQGQTYFVVPKLDIPRLRYNLVVLDKKGDKVADKIFDLVISPF